MNEIVYIVTVPRERFDSSPDYARDRELLEALAGVPCRMIHYTELDAAGPGPDTPRILSGGKAGPDFPFEEVFYDEAFRRILAEDAPTLAICRSFQLASALLGAEVCAMPQRPGLIPKDGGWYEEGPNPVRILREDPLFEGLGPVIRVHQNHRNEVRSIPKGVVALAESPACPVQAWRHPERLFYGLQFHPERGGHADGHRILHTFFHMQRDVRYPSEPSPKQNG
jgi:GMP synthase-like glutamine amidotransferase